MCFHFNLYTNKLIVNQPERVVQFKTLLLSMLGQNYLRLCTFFHDNHNRYISKNELNIFVQLIYSRNLCYAKELYTWIPTIRSINQIYKLTKNHRLMPNRHFILISHHLSRDKNKVNVWKIDGYKLYNMYEVWQPRFIFLLSFNILNYTSIQYDAADWNARI